MTETATNGPWRMEAQLQGTLRTNVHLEAVQTDGLQHHLLWADGPIAPTSPLVFKTVEKRETLTDYPYVTNSWPVFSARVAALFGDEVTKVPVTVIHVDRIHDSASFVLCTPTRLTDGLDPHATEFAPNRFNPTGPPQVVTPVLRPDVAWPSLFRLRGYPVRLFVNDETRTAIEAPGARGVAFFAVETT